VIGPRTRLFVDIGAGTGINSNCANLAIHHGWHGLFIDGNAENIERGKRFYSSHPSTSLYPPVFVSAMVKRDTINSIIEAAGFHGEVDLVSIDIDGNDYWIWDALEAVSPRLVIIETHVEFGLNNVVVPYDPDYVYPPGAHPQYFGASVTAMADLAERRGYRLVGSNRFGFNTIWLRHTEAVELIPTLPVERLLQHPRNAERAKLFDPIRDWPYVRPQHGGEATKAS
jgi:hypothetical protein